MAESNPVNPAVPSAGDIVASLKADLAQAGQPQGQVRDEHGRFAVAGDPPSASGTPEAQPLAGDVTVMIDGVARKVNIEELVGRATRAERVVQEAEVVKRTAAQQLAANAEALRLQEAFTRLSPVQQQQVLAQITGAQAAPLVHDDPFGSPQPNPLEGKVSQMEQVLRAQAEMLAAIGGERQAQNLDRTVETEMAALPIFGEVAQPLREMAKDAILRAIQSQGRDADVRGTVLELAKRAQDVHRATINRQTPGLVPSQLPNLGNNSVPKMTAADLARGKGASLVRQALAQYGVNGM